MERFNYPNIDAAEQEDCRILYWLDCERYGYKRDEEERLAEEQAELESRMPNG